MESVRREESAEGKEVERTESKPTRMLELMEQRFQEAPPGRQDHWTKRKKRAKNSKNNAFNHSLIDKDVDAIVRVWMVLTA